MGVAMNWAPRHAVPDRIVVTVTDPSELMTDMLGILKSGNGFSLATLNLDHVVKFKRDSQFLTAYAAHTHVCADGNPIVWLSRLAGQQDVKLIPGSELVEPVAAMAAAHHLPIALVGATQTTLDATAADLQARYDGLQVALCHAPEMGFDPAGQAAEVAITAIGASKARIVFLALGAPRQERFAAHAQAVLPTCGFLSIGAGLDFISGEQKRAPVWVRRFAAEWLWRALSNPKRLAGRYALCLLALPQLTLRAISQRLKGS